MQSIFIKQTVSEKKIFKDFFFSKICLFGAPATNQNKRSGCEGHLKGSVLLNKHFSNNKMRLQK